MPDGIQGSATPLFGLTPRLPPTNMQAEQALLGALLSNSRAAYEKVSDFLKPDHFADPVHARIYQAVSERCEAGEVADAVTLHTDFKNTGVLDEVGGTAYLTQLMTAMVGIINAGDYGKAVYNTWLLRQMITLGEEIVNRAFGSVTDFGDGVAQIEWAEQRLSELSTGSESSVKTVTAAQGLARAIENGEAIRTGKGARFASTGIAPLDARMHGMFDGDLIVIAGRPGMGKTSLAVNFAKRLSMGRARTVTEWGEVLDDGDPSRPVAFFSLEAPSERISSMLASDLACVELANIMTGNLTNDEGVRLLLAQREIGKAQFHINDRPRHTLSSIRRECRQLIRKHGKLAAVIVDYIQIMGAPANAPRDRNDLLVGGNANGLKELAKELGCPVIALAQLNRKVEDRTDRRPQLSDLKESGGIEEAADAVILMYREAYYFDKERPKFDPNSGETRQHFNSVELPQFERKYEEIKDMAEANLAKLRIGKPGTLDLGFDAEFYRFREPTV